MDVDYKYISIDEVDRLQGLVYVLVAGTMGAGKSTIISKHIKTIKLMDIDEVIAELGNGVYDRENMYKAYEIISKEIFQMMARKESLVAMGTSGSVYSAIERLVNAKELGYKTVLIHVHVPVEQAIKQNRERIKRGERGVKLAEEYKIGEVYCDVDRTVRHLKHMRLLDYIVEYDNTRDV